MRRFDQRTRDNNTVPYGLSQPRSDLPVADWLKTRENGSAGAKGNAIANYSFGWLWTELGVEELRR